MPLHFDVAMTNDIVAANQIRGQVAAFDGEVFQQDIGVAKFPEVGAVPM